MMLRALATPHAPILPVATEARETPRAGGNASSGQKETAPVSNAKEARKASPAPVPAPKPPKEPAPTAAIPRNNGKNPIQTLTPSGGIDE